jgi:diaminopimelate epimerase
MTAFFKVSGSGNDFVALADPPADPAPERIRAWCRRGISLGADGVFALRRGPGAAEVSMAYFNADGHPADLCLNGTRGAAQLAFHLGWAATDSVAVRTAAGTFHARRLDNRRVALELDAEMSEPQELAVETGGTHHRGYSVRVGVPHFLLLWPGNLDDAPVLELGRQLRHHPVFQPAGTNVSFVRLESGDRLAIRTYERGVEDETLSCGTGVVAAARLGLALGRLACPITALTRSGFELTVDRDPANLRFTLAGDARIVAAGELLAGAEA